MSMERYAKLKIALCALVLGAAINAPAMAVTIDYTDEARTPYKIQTPPAWVEYWRFTTLFPGTTDAPEASNNTINIYYTPQGYGGPLPALYYVYGGVSNSGDAHNNAVTLTRDEQKLNSRVYQNITGAYIEGENTTGSAYKNKVTIDGGKVGNDVYGVRLGAGVTGSAYDNTVEVINGGIVAANAIGAYLKGGGTGNAYNNTVTINNGTVGYSVYGVYLGNNATGDATSNTVTITNGSEIYYSSNNAPSSVYGAYLGKDVKGNANDNKIEISGDSTLIHGDVYCAVLQAGAEGGASGNLVTMTGGAVSYNLYNQSIAMRVPGGYIFGAYLVAGATGDATGNTVKISGGTVGDEYDNTIGGGVYGAYLEEGVIGEAKNNTVHISGNPNLSMAGLYGNNQNSWATDGNTLIVEDYRGTYVDTVANFQNYQFIIGDAVTDTNAALVVTNEVDLTGANVKIIGFTTPLNEDSELMLIDNTNAGELASYTSTLSIKGFSTVYQFEYYYNDEQALMVRIGSVNTNTQTKAFSEGFLAGAVFLNQKNDLMSNWGLPAMGEALKNHPNARFVPFAAMQGGGLTYKTGSSLNVKGFSGLAGVALGFSNNLSAGVFFEGGWGNYSTRNSFNNTPNVKGDGGTRYYGGGVMVRQNNIWQGLYAQGYFSIGRSEVDFRTNDMINMAGQRAQYDSSSTYYSAHAGLGYLLELWENAKADIYARYLWNRTGRDNVNVGGDPVKFKAVDSHRLQLGARAHYTLIPGFTPYAGALWEYEFGGKAKGRINDINIDAPSVRGATGMGELGFTLRPDLDAPLYIEAGVQGYIGKREGITGTLRLSLAF